MEWERDRDKWEGEKNETEILIWLYIVENKSTKKQFNVDPL